MRVHIFFIYNITKAGVFQPSFTCFFWTGLRRNVDFREKIYYNEKLVMSA